MFNRLSPGRLPCSIPPDGRPMRARDPLAPAAAELRRLVEAAMARIVPHLEPLPQQPAAAVAGGAALARALREPLPRAGCELEELLDLVFERAVPCSFNTAGPGYLAYI